jgi:hypothetical protein
MHFLLLQRSYRRPEDDEERREDDGRAKRDRAFHIPEIGQTGADMPTR